jgi:hypothetical protein
LFRSIESQTTDDDRRSLLAVQRAIRQQGEYVFLEIGSHLGGTLQPHLLDPRCRKIYSIDPRPLIVDDERGEKQKYFDNSTDRMMRLLNEVGPDQIDKIATIDSAASDIVPNSIDHKPNLCFIDGEHTNAAVLSDFELCSKVIAPNGAVIFHDSNLVYSGIRTILASLRASGVDHTPMKLGGTVFTIAFGKSIVASDPYLRSISTSVRYHFLRSAIRLRISRFKIKRKARKRSN